MLILIAVDILEDLFRTAAEQGAKIVQRFGADGFVLPELVQGGTGDIVMVDHSVSRFFRIFKGFPKRCVIYHA